MATFDSLTTSEALQQLIVNTHAETITLHELKEQLHERSFGFLLLLLSFPIALPLPYPPGFTAIVGAPLFIFSLQMIWAADSPWLPAWIGQKTIKRDTLITVITKSLPYLRRLERYTKPRLAFASEPLGERIVGLMSLLCSISIVLPIIFGNAIPSAGISVMALGLLNRDGITIIAGIVIGFIGLLISTAMVLLGVAGVKLLLSHLWS